MAGRLDAMMSGEQKVVSASVLIYKVLMPNEWADFQAYGRFEGSEFDRESGFVHGAARDQVAGVVARFFADATEIVVVGLDTEMLGSAVRWEDSPDGRFPHVYAALPRSAVIDIHLDGRAFVERLEGSGGAE